MTPVRFLLLSSCLGAAACASPGPGGGPTPERPTTVALSLPAVRATEVALAEDSAGLAKASIGFGGPLPDDQIVALLRRFDVLPYTLYFAMAGRRSVYDVPVARAHLGLLADMRRERGADPCALVARLQAMRRIDANVRVAPGERDEPARRRLTDIRVAQQASERLRQGEPVVFGVRVVGRTANLRRLAADQYVRDFHGAIHTANGARLETLVPGIDSPSDLGGTPRTPTPGVESMSTAEVHAQLDRLLDTPPAECREAIRNQVVSEPVAPLKRSGAGEYVFAGLRFSAASRLVTPENATREAPGARTPSAVRVTLTITNPSANVADVGIRGCTMLVQLYRADTPSSAPAMDKRRGMQCMQAPMRLRLASGESREFSQQDEAWRLLGDSLPFGRYRVAVLYRLEDGTVEIPAGEVQVSSGLEGLAYSAALRVVDTAWRASVEAVLRASASLTNRSDRPVHIEYGACALSMRAYRNPQRTGTPAWRSEWREPWGGRAAYGCPAYLARHTLRPGETFGPREFHVSAPVVELLADSLPDGRYWFAATLRLNHRNVAEFAAGSALLVLPRPPLAGTRMANNVRYEARSELTHATVGDSSTVRGIVTASLPYTGGALLRYSAECPVVLYVYRDRARRDAAPRSGAPDWKSRDECGPELQQIILQHGEWRTFEVRSPVREILDSGLPPGRYYLALAVLGERRKVVLSAGEAVFGR